jgi:hypothetical protein
VGGVTLAFSSSVILSGVRRQPSGVEGPLTYLRRDDFRELFQHDYEYWTCIVASLSGTLYIGMTNNIDGNFLDEIAPGSN